MRMLRTPPFFPPKSGENHIWKYFPDWACGAILNDNISAFRLIKTTQLIPDEWNFTSATLNHIRFVCFFYNIKDNEWNLCQDLLTIENTDSDYSYLYASDFPLKNFCKIAQHTETIRKSVWEKSNDAYSSIRVQTTINHISIFTFCFLRQYQRQRKCFLSERELKKALRDTLTRAAWLGPSNFLLVRSEHAHASYPGLFFCPPGFSPYMGREERRVQGLD